MAIIDELKGVLGEDAIAKIQAAGLADKLVRGEELVTYLDDGRGIPESGSISGFTLEDLTKTLKTSFTDFETSLTPKFSEIAKEQAKAVVQAEGSAFLGRAIRMADDTMQIRNEHKQLFGEDLDLEALNKFVGDSGRTFSSPKEAYKEWTRDRHTELEVERRAEEKAKEKSSSQSIPGVTPAAATGVRGALKAFGRAVNADGKTRAEVLNEKLSQLERAS